DPHRPAVHPLHGEPGRVLGQPAQQPGGSPALVPVLLPGAGPGPLRRSAVRRLGRAGARGRARLGSVSAGRLSLFCDTALAGRIEWAEAQLVAEASEAACRRTEAAGFVIPIAGGVASFAGEDSPFNKVAGLGFGGTPGAAALDEIERAFAARRAPVQAQLASLADPQIGAPFSRR